MAIASSPRDPAPTPPRIQGLRIPNLEVVRSLKRPKNGFARTAMKAPTPSTSERLPAALSGFTCRILRARDSVMRGKQGHPHAHIGQRVGGDETEPHGPQGRKEPLFHDLFASVRLVSHGFTGRSAGYFIHRDIYYKRPFSCIKGVLRPNCVESTP